MLMLQLIKLVNLHKVFTHLFADDRRVANAPSKECAAMPPSKYGKVCSITVPQYFLYTFFDL